jgi:hypothetical protein
MVQPKSVLEIKCYIFLRCRVRSCNLINFVTLRDKHIYNKSFILTCEPIYMADFGLALHKVGFSAEKYILRKRTHPK